MIHFKDFPIQNLYLVNMSSLCTKHSSGGLTDITLHPKGTKSVGHIDMFKYRRNISIGIPLDLSIPTEMTSIEPLVENEKSSKTQKKLKIMLFYIFSD